LKQRSSWYLAITTTKFQDEVSSRKGIVAVSLNVGSHRISYDKLPLIFEEDKVYKAIPHKVASVHCCFDDILGYPVITLLRFFIGSRARGRLKTHFAKQRADYIYELQTYGIPTQVFPVDEHDNLILDHHLEWIQGRRAQESSSSPCPRIAARMVPLRFDVLLGRGPMISGHTGNLRAFHIVEMQRERYEKNGKFEKTHIADRVVHLIHTSYGRFLKKENSVWVEVSRDEAREKISHCFRRLRLLESRAEKSSDLAAKRDGRESDAPDPDANDLSPKVNVIKRAKSSSSSTSS
jgi:hypothetical protein